MIGKKINELATELAPASTDLTIIGNPTTGVSKKITLAQLGAIFSGAVSFYTNYASFPSIGTTDVIFCAKDTKKLYLWNGSAYVEVFPSQALLDTYQLRSEKGVSNGYASLDSSGKVPVSQLPSSIMEYKGTWSAATNTPTLANGTGDTGDVYICNAAGSVNFGAGSITFAVGDYVIYSGSIWQRSSGAVGTVTSVGVTRSGDALAITGSPITTSGTINIGFAGTGAQYIKGDGTLATFPTIISQAQNLVSEVYNETGATLTKGTVVYINNGHGNLPTVTKAIATGDSTSAQTYGIVQADITNNNNGYVVVAGRLENMDTQALANGTQLYLSSTTAGAYTSTKQYAPAHLVYVGIIVRSHPTQGVIEVKIQNGYEMDELHNVSAQTPTNNDGLFWEASTNLWKNKSLATIIGGTPAYGSGTQNRIPKFTANAGQLIDSNLHDTGTVIYNNNATAGQFAWQFNGSQTTGQSYGALIVAGTNASDIAFRIQNASSTSEYFFVWGDGRVQINNIPNATTDTDRFLVSDSGVIKYRTGTELLSDIGGQPAGTYVTSVGLSAPTGFDVSGSPVTSSGTLALSFSTGYSLPTTAKQGNWDTAYNTRIVTASSPLSFISNTLSIAQASGSQSGYLSSTDWTTFNNKQSALTNPVTGTGTTNYLPKFTGTSTIGNSAIYDNGGNIGINTTSASEKLVVKVGTNQNIEVRQASSLGAYTGVGLDALNDARTDIVDLVLRGKTLSLQANTTQMEFLTNSTEKMRLNISGNLSIGNTNDTYKLDVNGTGRFTSNVTTDGRFILTTNTSPTAQGQIGYNASGGLYIWSKAGSSYDFTLYNKNGNEILQVPTGTQNATFSSKVSAGSSTETTNAFSGVNNSSSQATIYSYNYNAAGWSIYSAQGINYFANSVGIGTTSPTSGQLVVKSSSFQYIAEPSDATTYGYLGIGHFTNGTFIGTYTGSNTASDLLRFGTSGTERMRITSGGELCVGRTSAYGAGFLLNVQGNIYASAAITTGAPSGGSAGSWKLGTFTSGTFVQGGKVRVEINGVAYDLLTT